MSGSCVRQRIITGGLRTLRPRCLYFSDSPYRFCDLHDDVSHRFLRRAEPSARGKRRAHLVEFFECHAMHSRDEKASAEQGALFIAPYAPVGTLDPITSGWVNRQPSSPEYRRSASSSRPSCSVRSVETRCTYRTSRRRASTLPPRRIVWSRVCSHRDARVAEVVFSGGELRGQDVQLLDHGFAEQFAGQNRGSPQRLGDTP